jgi:hypothetical protein
MSEQENLRKELLKQLSLVESKWGHPETDQGGVIEKLFLMRLTEAQIIENFALIYPQHKDPRTRVKDALRHFRDIHGADINLCLGKGTSTDSSLPVNADSSIGEIPNKEDVEAAESQLRKNSDEIIGIETVLDQIENNFKKSGKPLKNNWLNITRKNIEIWFAVISCKRF